MNSFKRVRRAFQIELECGIVGFWGDGKTGIPGEKPLGARERTNNKLNPHMASTPGFEPGPHWWEASALTTAPPLLTDGGSRPSGKRGGGSQNVFFALWASVWAKHMREPAPPGLLPWIRFTDWHTMQRFRVTETQANGHWVQRLKPRERSLENNNRPKKEANSTEWMLICNNQRTFLASYCHNMLKKAVKK